MPCNILYYVLVSLLLLTSTVTASWSGDPRDDELVEPNRPDNWDPTRDAYRQDFCTACKTVFDRLDEEMTKRAGGTVRGIRRKVDYATSEARALEILDSDLCRMALGSTRQKCQRWVEEYEEHLVDYIRTGKHYIHARRSFCAKWCGKEWEDHRSSGPTTGRHEL